MTFNGISFKRRQWWDLNLNLNHPLKLLFWIWKNLETINKNGRSQVLIGSRSETRTRRFILLQLALCKEEMHFVVALLPVEGAAVYRAVHKLRFSYFRKGGGQKLRKVWWLMVVKNWWHGGGWGQKVRENGWRHLWMAPVWCRPKSADFGRESASILSRKGGVWINLVG